MKFKLLYISLSAFLLISCDQAKKNTKTPSPEKETKQVIIRSRCYSYTSNRDTIYLEVTSLEDSLVEGHLTFNFFEKDRNNGSFKGKWKGDSLFADYEFKSEGKLSTREIFFVKTDSGLIEGYGPIKDTLNKAIFKDHRSLRLNKNMLLKPVDCY